MTGAAMWARALDLVRAHRIESDAEAGPLFDNPPFGSDPEVLRRLRQMYEAGGWVLVESAIADLPADLRWLFESGAVTIEQLAELHRALGIVSAADLAAAVREQNVRAIPGLGAEVESAISSALPALRARIPRVPLGRAVAIAEPVLDALRGVPGVAWAIPVGSLRRGQDMVGDIEILAPTDQPADAIDALLELPAASHVLHRSERRLYALADRVQIGVRLPATVQCRRRSPVPDRIARALRRPAGACRRPGPDAHGRRTVFERSDVDERRRQRTRSMRPSASRSSRRRSETATTR